MIVEQDKGIQTLFSRCAPHLCLDELESRMSPFDFSPGDWEQLHGENARELPAVHGLYCGVQSRWHITIFAPCPVPFPNSDFLLGTVRTTALGQSTVWWVYNSSPLHVFEMSVDAYPLLKRSVIFEAMMQAAGLLVDTKTRTRRQVANWVFDQTGLRILWKAVPRQNSARTGPENCTANCKRCLGIGWFHRPILQSAVVSVLLSIGL